jgi:transcription elongation factor GreA
MSDDIKQKLQDDLRQLEAELRTEIPQELKKAVAMGDLSENAEYEAARNRQDYVRARIANLRIEWPMVPPSCFTMWMRATKLPINW